MLEKTYVMYNTEHLPPYRLFLIEDSPAEVRLIQEAVKEAGLSDLIEFEYAYDGEEACELLDESKINGKKYDLILLDLNLPKKNCFNNHLK